MKIAIRDLILGLLLLVMCLVAAKAFGRGKIVTEDPQNVEKIIRHYESWQPAFMNRVIFKDGLDCVFVHKAITCNWDAYNAKQGWETTVQQLESLLLDKQEKK